MANNAASSLWLALLLLLLLQVQSAAAFGAGNIASVSKIEGRNWRHGDIEDMLKTVAFIKGHKWTSMMVKRVYFGNWLRDYSQAVDVGTLKGVQSGTIRILVWILSFLSFGYATEEFEVTEERLGVYRPEEHIDNPKDYADNVDARQFDPRLRPPVQSNELAIDPRTGMKNYIANEDIGIATSSGYIRYSFSRSIHFGRLYTNGAGHTKGKEADLFEALRCLGQGLHCCEDFGAHSNYTELALREQGHRNVFPHTGLATEIDLGGRRVFPIVTGTFGAVDFLHSVLGEANDHFAQTEVEELNNTLVVAQSTSGSSGGSRAFGESGGGASMLTGLLSQVPGAGPLCREAEQLHAESQAQEQMNQGHASRQAEHATRFAAPPGSQGGPPGPGIPGLDPNYDPAQTVAKIYPILAFRDKVVRAISATIEKIPGLEALVDKITENVTLFVLGLLAPFVRPIIEAVSNSLKTGSSTVVDASGKHQYEVWTDAHCSDPTHSLLSKDHFSNILNEPAGQVAAAILQYVAPRVFYAWEHPDIPVEQVLNDIVRVFHHPAIRDPACEVHRTMYDIVERWARSQPNGGAQLNDILSSEGVRTGKNHQGDDTGHSHGALPAMGDMFGAGGSSNSGNSLWSMLQKFGQSTGLTRDGANFEREAGNTGSEYPGTDSPPTGPLQDYGGYGQPPYNAGPPAQFNGYYDASAQQQYQQSYGAQPQYGYQQPPPEYYAGAQGYGGPPSGQASGYYSGNQ